MTAQTSFRMMNDELMWMMMNDELIMINDDDVRKTDHPRSSVDENEENDENISVINRNY